MGWGGTSLTRLRPTLTHTANPKHLPSPWWGGDGGGGHTLGKGLAVHRVQNQLHHPLDIPRNLRIPEPQHLKPPRRQPLIPLLIALPTMPTAVYLNHQPPPQLSEIRDERPNRSLPPKVQPQHPVQLPQLGPHLPLLWRHLRPQFPRASAGDWVDSGHPSHPLPEAPHPNPPHKGEGAPNCAPPALTPTASAPPLPLVGRGWGWGALSFKRCRSAMTWIGQGVFMTRRSHFHWIGRKPGSFRRRGEQVHRLHPPPSKQKSKGPK